MLLRLSTAHRITNLSYPIKVTRSGSLSIPCPTLEVQEEILSSKVNNTDTSNQSPKSNKQGERPKFGPQPKFDDSNFYFQAELKKTPFSHQFGGSGNVKGSTS